LTLVTTEPDVRLRLDLAYDGTAFSGWSTQPGLRTVQGELESALATLLRSDRDDDLPSLIVAGRTDAGVHATGQVAHLDLSHAQWASLVRLRRSSGPARSDGPRAVDARSPEGTLVRRLNGIIGAHGDVVVNAASIAPPGFDARFSPLWRKYEYRLADLTAIRDPRHRWHTLWFPGELDEASMQAAAAELVGLHNFAAFCRPRPKSTTIRTLLDFSWRRDTDGVLIATVQADAFCHSMVRALVGAAVRVGQGRLDLERLKAVRDQAVRTSAFPVVGAQGLTLVEVRYPDDQAVAERALLTRARRELTPARE
jgi:tRNA pseudouridine38-40 synthase